MKSTNTALEWQPTSDIRARDEGAPEDVARDAPAPPPLARRLAERFALLAFGLFHVPLFLNNYPSLGGGGFGEGLAVRWGHVFTRPGIWLARHLFGLTGPMTQAMRGDNGDVGEEWARLILCVAIGGVAAVLWTIADRRRPRAAWVENAVRVLLRYAIALGLVSYALAKVVPQQFPPLQPYNYEIRVGELTPMGLLWTFMRYSRPYAFFGGAMECVAIALLCFRRTATLGAVTTIAVMTNVALMNWTYDVPVKLYSTMLVVSAGVLVLYDGPRLFAVFVADRGAAPARQPALFEGRLPIGARWAIKLALVGSVTASSLAAFVPRLGAASTVTDVINGAWSVTTFTHGTSDGKVTPAWRRVIVNGEAIALRLEDETLVRCRRAADGADATKIALSCRGDRKGQLRATMDGATLRLDGTFDGASLSATARRLGAEEYRLMKGGVTIFEDGE